MPELYHLEDPMTHDPIPYLGTRLFKIPVNKENVIKSGILDAKYADQIPEYIALRIPENKQVLSKPELFLLDFLSHYEWDRPLSLLSKGGDLNIGIKDYLMYDGFSYRFVPLRHPLGRVDNGNVDPYDLYDKVMNVYTWDSFSREDYYVDYHHLYTFCGVLPQRRIFVETANALLSVDEPLKALEVLDKCQKSVPETQYPLDISLLEFSNEYMVVSLIESYYMVAEAIQAHAAEIEHADSRIEYARKQASGLAQRFALQNLENVTMSCAGVLRSESELVDAEDYALRKAANQRRVQADPDAYLAGLYEASRDPKKINRFTTPELQFLLAMERYGAAQDKLDASKVYLEHLVGMTKTYGDEELSDSLDGQLKTVLKVLE